MSKKFQYLKNHFFDSPKKKFISIVTGVAIVAVAYVGVSFKTITIDVDGKPVEAATLKWTVQDVLKQEGIVLGQKDKVSPSLDEKLSRNDVIKINKAREVVLLVDGKEKTIKTAEASIKDMLKAEKVKLGEKDRVEPGLDTKIAKGQKIEVVRVEEKLVKEKEDIDFETIVKKNSKLDKTVKKVVQAGSKGEKEITIKVIYENGKEVGKNILSEKVLVEPQEKIIEQGTKQTLALAKANTPVSRGNSGSVAVNGSTSSNSNQVSNSGSSSNKTMTMQATAYYQGSVTATGTTPRRNPGGLSTIAVDPRVIPLGSKVYVSGYGYAIAEDTGGAVKNNIIDLYMNSASECYNWGRRSVQVTIIAYPGQW